MTGNENDPSVDLILQWRDSDARRDSASDSIAVGDPEESEAGEALAGGGSGGEFGSLESIAEDAPLEHAEDEDDEFEWSEEREQALMDALDSAPEGTPAQVQQQLEAIASALEAKELIPEAARRLLSEVDAYLLAQLQRETRKRPVAHPEFMQARAEKLNALAAWQECAGALRAYVETGEEVQLKVARYAGEQASSFLSTSWELLLAAEPLEDEDYEDFEDDLDEPEDEEELDEDGPRESH